jgi:hypothetical protein
VHLCLWFLNQSYHISQKEEEGVRKNGRNGRHQESTKPNICTSNTTLEVETNKLGVPPCSHS